MIQTWSFESLDTPIVAPRIQWFGRGFGQVRSTSNCGAMTVAAWTADRFESAKVVTPRTERIARSATLDDEPGFIPATPPLTGSNYYTPFYLPTKRKILMLV